MQHKELIGNTMVEPLANSGQVGGWVMKPTKTDLMFGGMEIVMVGKRLDNRAQKRSIAENSRNSLIGSLCGDTDC